MLTVVKVTDNSVRSRFYNQVSSQLFRQILDQLVGVDTWNTANMYIYSPIGVQVCVRVRDTIKDELNANTY